MLIATILIAFGTIVALLLSGYSVWRTDQLRPKPELVLSLGLHSGDIDKIRECEPANFKERSQGAIVLKTRNAGHAYPYSLERLSMRVVLYEDSKPDAAVEFDPTHLLTRMKLPVRLDAGDVRFFGYYLNEVIEDMCYRQAKTWPPGEPHQKYRPELMLDITAEMTTSSGDEISTNQSLVVYASPIPAAPDAGISGRGKRGWYATHAYD